MQLSNQRGGDQASFWKGWRFNVAKNDGSFGLGLDLKLSDQEGEPLMTCRDQQPKHLLAPSTRLWG